MHRNTPKIVIIGAGIGGLASALRLSAQGYAVTVLDSHNTPGGKMRTIASRAGPVDAGPTVLTMRSVFEALFWDVGEALNDHITLNPLKILARHHWDDGKKLDLMADEAQSHANIEAAFGTHAAAQFTAFSARAKRLFEAFDAPMMQAAIPDRIRLVKRVLQKPRLVADMAAHRSLAGLLKSSFDDPRLAQLFGRYATYVGGSPYMSPAILALISAAEAQGVWTVEGGMYKLAKTLETLAKDRGVLFMYNTHATQITQRNNRICGVDTAAGHIAADAVLFNGDPRALETGLLGSVTQKAVRRTATEPRSLSAYVYAFAAAPDGPSLAHHNVFFGHDPKAEFDALKAGQMPTDATLYVCAQDHEKADPSGIQRFEIIMNGPPVFRDTKEEKERCQTLIFNRLKAFGLTFSQIPDLTALTTPQGFSQLFPASNGSLYGRSPHGLMATFKRPTARTKIPGLYLCGGGAHPGAGVPMATLSAKHAAAAIMADLALPSTSRQMAMHGGTSTGSAKTGPKPSL